MGEARRKQSATARFIAEHPICCLCGTSPATTREHMPPKALFDGSHRPDKLVMPACDRCNGGTRTSDLAVAIVSRWDYHQSSASLRDHSRLVARARRQAPHLLDDWTGRSNLLYRIKAKRHLRQYGVRVPDDAGIATIGEPTIRLLNLFAHKAVLALYYEHVGRPLSSPGRYCAFWKTKEDMLAYGLPTQLIHMLPDYNALVAGRWDTSEVFEYRHSHSDDGLFGVFARLRTSLFIAGFAVDNISALPEVDDDWMEPGDLLGLMDHARFARKL